MKQDDDLSSFHTEKWTKCRSCKGDLSHHVCEGKFQVFRPSTTSVNREALSPITITVLVPCSLHAMPPRIRQTFLEHKQLSKAVVAGQIVRIVDRDPAGKANNQMHRQRVRRLKSTLKKNRSVELKDLQKLGVYHSSKDLMTFLIRAPYEQRAMITSKGLTLHVDSTFRVINPTGDERDFRSAPQLITLTIHSTELRKHVILRGQFAQPVNRSVYCDFFLGFFRQYGLPAKNTYTGLSADFSTSQLQGLIIALVTVARELKNLKPLSFDEILSSQELVEKAIKRFRGCLFHYEKAIIELKCMFFLLIFMLIYPNIALFL